MAGTTRRAWALCSTTRGCRSPVVSNGATLTLSNLFVGGDPEGVGILERPDMPHSASNRFTARYFFMIAPANKTLDINYIHNQAAAPTRINVNPMGSDFLRNQGVGTWEVNLALLPARSEHESVCVGWHVLLQPGERVSARWKRLRQCGVFHQ
jgi:hypothetical protein